MSPTLMSPLRVGTIELKNRMAVAPMVTCYCDDDGMPTEQYIAYHEARARGGFGLIITENYAVDPIGRGFWCAGLWKDEQIAPHSELARRVHAAGAKIFTQLYHCGRQTSSAIIGAQPVAPSALPCPVMSPRSWSPPSVRMWWSTPPALGTGVPTSPASTRRSRRATCSPAQRPSDSGSWSRAVA